MRDNEDLENYFTNEKIENASKIAMRQIKEENKIKEHKTWFYSLREAKVAIGNMADDMRYAENEGKLTACFHYLKEYESKLKKENTKMSIKKILVGKNTFFYTSDNMLRFLINKLGRTEDFWNNFFYRHEKLFRTSKRIQEVFAESGFIIKNEDDSEDIYKIIEVPNNINWYVDNYECAVGEFIAEEHRIWK